MDDLLLRELLKDSCCPFLAAYENEWINGNGEVLTFDEMKKRDNKYLENCFNYLIRQKDTVERGSFLSGMKYDKKLYAEIVSEARILYLKKLKELNDYITRNR